MCKALDRIDSTRSATNILAETALHTLFDTVLYLTLVVDRIDRHSAAGHSLTSITWVVYECPVCNIMRESVVTGVVLIDPEEQ